MLNIQLLFCLLAFTSDSAYHQIITCVKFLDKNTFRKFNYIDILSKYPQEYTNYTIAVFVYVLSSEERVDQFQKGWLRLCVFYGE